MFIISKEIEFDAGHRVPLHESKCKNPHGHRYKVRATISGELITEGPESGMVRDFGNIKALLTRYVHDVYDHGFMIYTDDEAMVPFVEMAILQRWKVIITDFIPTAECLAKSIFETLQANGLPNLVEITVFETPTSTASYSELAWGEERS
jgi:6-pyruvoyltetrahydropterin/6-carboxytetrahydropterin synthase